LRFVKKALFSLWMLVILPGGIDPSFAQEAAVDYAAGPIWEDLVRKEGTHYRLSAPSAWRNMDVSRHALAVYFEASGKILPLVHDGAPVIVTVFLESFPATSLKDARNDVIAGYGQNPDRVFPAGPTHEEEEFPLTSGQKAHLVNTRFYRKSNGLNQSRYDLVAFLEESQLAFMYTLSIQYRDDSYALEDTLQLKSIAHRLFGYFELK